MSASAEISLIAALISAACALPGAFLVFRHMSMMTDAITHSILLGIVLAFFQTRDLSSPWLIVGATLMGVFTVWLTEKLADTNLVKEDAAIGVVFSTLFSVAIILIAMNARSVHIDTDSVLLGELAFAPFDRLVLFGRDLGARSLYTSGAVLLINLSVIGIFYKELRLTTFDPAFAAAIGFSPVTVHYVLMLLASMTSVVAFEAVGSVLVVAFMIIPPVTATFLTNNLKAQFALSALIGALSGVFGYAAAVWLGVSIAGCMAVVCGLMFLLAFLFAPKRGMISELIRYWTRKVEFDRFTLLTHLMNHAGSAIEERENSLSSLPLHLGWAPKRVERASKYLLNKGALRSFHEVLFVTDQGKADYLRYCEELFGEAEERLAAALAEG